jgi:hypothetical protein
MDALYPRIPSLKCMFGFGVNDIHSSERVPINHNDPQPSKTVLNTFAEDQPQEPQE